MEIARGFVTAMDAQTQFAARVKTLSRCMTRQEVTQVLVSRTKETTYLLLYEILEAAEGGC